MKKDKLQERLDATLESFKKETQFLDDYSKNPVSEGELKEAIKQVFYVLNDFKNALLDYID